MVDEGSLKLQIGAIWTDGGQSLRKKREKGVKIFRKEASGG